MPLEMLTPLSWSATAWPAAPGKVSTAFCPGTVVATATAGPPGVIEAVASGGTANTVTVMVPTVVPVGSTSTVYVPSAESCVRSRKAPEPANGFGVSDEPSGRRIATVPLGNVLPVSWTLTIWPAPAANVSRAFSPGSVVVTLTELPPATTGTVRSDAAKTSSTAHPPRRR